MPAPAVFFDRDDTLIHCNELPVAPPPAKRGDHVHPHLVTLLPGALEACTALKAAGFKLVVISNQGAVARGAAPLALVEEVNDRMRALLRVPSLAAPEVSAPQQPNSRRSDGEARVSLIDATYYCPFHPQGQAPRFTREHDWRKPNPGMLKSAAAELGLDLARSWLIGDAPRDIEAGINAGLPAAHCLLLQPGSSTPDLAAAARTILGNRS